MSIVIGIIIGATIMLYTLGCVAGYVEGDSDYEASCKPRQLDKRTRALLELNARRSAARNVWGIRGLTRRKK